MPSISTPEMPPRLLLTPAIDIGAAQVDRHDIPLVPRKAIVIKNHSGAEVSLADLKAKYVPPCTITAPVIIPVKIETEEARAKRVASVEKPAQEGLPKGTAEKTGQHREEHLKQKRQKEMERSQHLQPESIPTAPDEHTSLASPVPLAQRRASVDSVIPPSPSSGIVVDNAPSSVSAPCSRKPSGDATLQSTSVASNGCSCRAPPETSKSSRKRALEHPPSITVSTNSRVREDSDNAPLDTAVSSSSTLVFASISSPARTPKSTDLQPQPSQSASHDPTPTQAEIKRRYHQHVQLLTIRQTHQRVVDMHDELQSRHEETMRTFEREKAQMKKLMTVSAELLEQAGLLIEREEENWREEEQEFLGAAHQANDPRDSESATEVEAPTVEEQVLDRLYHFKERAEERTRKKAEEQNYEAPQLEEEEGEEVEQLEEEEEEEAEQLEEDEGEKTRQPENDEGEKAEQFEEGGGEQDEPLEENDAGTVDGNHTEQDDVSTSTSALAGVRAIQDLKSVKYPKGIRQPSTKLNKYSKPGKFRYNRDFLLQFKSICVEKPEFLFNLDDFGLGPSSYNVALYREQYRPWGEWMGMGSYAPHYTDWGVGPDLAGFQQPGVNMGQWAAYSTPTQLPFSYSGGGYFPHKKRYAKSYGAY